MYLGNNKETFKTNVIIAQAWNSLPHEIMCAESLNSFKHKLDKFWKNQQKVYDCKTKRSCHEEIRFLQVERCK